MVFLLSLDQRKKQGFSVLELLIAMTIIFMLILAMAYLMTYSIYLKRINSLDLEALALAHSKIENLKSYDFNSAELSENEKTEIIVNDSSNEKYQRSWQIHEISDEMKSLEMECYPLNCPRKKTVIFIYLSKDLGF